nr:hypothetical protein [Nitrosomonas sp.]
MLWQLCFGMGPPPPTRQKQKANWVHLRNPQPRISLRKVQSVKGQQGMENLEAHIAKLSPTARGIKNIPERVKRLEAYENPKSQTKMDFAAIVGSDVWTLHQSNFERVQLLKRESQALATKINTGSPMHTKHSNPAVKRDGTKNTPLLTATLNICL